MDDHLPAPGRLLRVDAHGPDRVDTVECETLALGWLFVRVVARHDGTVMDTDQHGERVLSEWAVEFRVLGPFEVWDGERLAPLSGRKQRALLALLVLRARQLVPTDVIVEELWGEAPPRTARDALHNYVSQVRRVIGSELLQTRDQGYLLAVEPDQVDLLRFERMVKEADVTGTIDQRAAMLREALDLWRGAPLSDLTYEPFALREAPRLDALRLVARLALIDAELELGHSRDLVLELEALVTANPFHEHLYAQLMLALYRCGRQAEALAVYRRARKTLLELLGIDPGPELRCLEQAILRQAPELDRPARNGSSPRRSGWKRVATATAKSVSAIEQLEVGKAIGGTLRRLPLGARGRQPLPVCTCGSPPHREGSAPGLL